ncbi:MAG: plastocyanin/azurin family copper-binding protein [Nitrosopumilaceae archaeon]
MNYYIILLLATFLFVPLVTNPAFAQQTFTINIPTGAASPDAPYFWQSEKDGKTDGSISIKVLDSVAWKNADTAAHTVTSGKPDPGSNGLFDSGLFGPGKTFQHQFTEVGDYEYFCLVHPWMTGVVTVTSGVKIIPNVGAKAGDGATTFNVEYEFNRVISSAKVDEEQKSITFEIVGKAMGEDNNLILNLPKNLIKGPFVIWADGKQISNYEKTEDGGINKIKIPLNRDTELVSIVGTAVVPEFGPIAMAVLAVGVFSLIGFTFKTRKLMKLN